MSFCKFIWNYRSVILIFALEQSFRIKNKLKNKQMKFKDKYGSYALVTGASSGIGAEMAVQLAQKGLNLVLVARRQDKLEQLRERIKRNANVTIRIIALDLLSNNFLETIKKTTDDLDIGLLVNNAGTMYIGNYLDCSLDRELQMINLNIKVPLVLTKHFAPKMVEKKKGGLIYTASMLGYMGTPYSSIYAGTKAFEIVKGEGLAYELKPYNIDVLTLNPGLTDTEMTANNDFSGMPMKLMKPNVVAKTAINALGKKVLVTPGVMNNIMNWMSKRIMSRKMNTSMFGMFMKKTF